MDFVGKCENLVEDYLGVPNFFNTPETPEKMMGFRKALNDRIKHYTQK